MPRAQVSSDRVSTRQVLRLGEAIYTVLRRAGFSDQAVIGTVHALLTIYILGFVALEGGWTGSSLRA